MPREFTSKNDLIDLKLFKQREVFLFEPIDADTVSHISRELIALDSEKKKIIRLFIYSPGGFVEAGLALVDLMQGLRSPIHTIIIGEACSMAGYISIHGTKRFITKNASWMGHEMHADYDDYHTKNQDRMTYDTGLWDKILKVYKEKTHLTDQDIDKLKRGELWLDAEACLRKGIVDKILA